MVNQFVVIVLYWQIDEPSGVIAPLIIHGYFGLPVSVLF